jgi:hypothetical protein
MENLLGYLVLSLLLLVATFVKGMEIGFEKEEREGKCDLD